MTANENSLLTNIFKLEYVITADLKYMIVTFSDCNPMSKQYMNLCNTTVSYLIITSAERTGF